MFATMKQRAMAALAAIALLAGGAAVITTSADAASSLTSSQTTQVNIAASQASTLRARLGARSYTRLSMSWNNLYLTARYMYTGLPNGAPGYPRCKARAYYDIQVGPSPTKYAVKVYFRVCD